MRDVDGKLSRANSLGILNASLLNRSNKVGQTDLDDLYRFKLSDRSSVNLLLSNITKGADVDVELYASKRPLNQVLAKIGKLDFRKLRRGDRNANLQLVAASRQSGNQDEKILSTLAAGDYFIRVLQRQGNSRYQLRLSAMAIDKTPPTASASTSSLFTNGGSTYDFTVTYSDNVALDVNSFDSNDIQVTGPNGFSQLATRIAMNGGSNSVSSTVTYRANAPGGTWGSADNGSYSIVLQANQVADTSGNFANVAALGNFLVRIDQPIPSDNVAPTASLSAANLLTSGGNTYDFTVTYSDNVAIDISSLDNDDIQVTGPNSFSQLATRISVNNSSSGTPLTATYRITAPGGTWNGVDNGSYNIALQNGQVKDTSNNFTSAATLGDFVVDIPRRLIQDSGGSAGSIQIYSLTVDTAVQPQGNVFPDALIDFQIKELATASGRIPVARNIDLGAGNITASLFNSGVQYTAQFPDYTGTKIDGTEFSFLSNQLTFYVFTDNPDSVINSLPSPLSFPGFAVFSTNARDANGEPFAGIASSSQLT